MKIFQKIKEHIKNVFDHNKGGEVIILKTLGNAKSGDTVIIKTPVMLKTEQRKRVHDQLVEASKEHGIKFILLDYDMTLEDILRKENNGT